MTTPKETIAEVLKALDHSDDTLWTSDGNPLVEVVQKLVGDDKVTRAQINDALPGYARMTAEQLAHAAEVAKLGLPVTPDAADDDSLMDTDETRSVLQNRVRRADEALTEARRAASEAVQEVTRAEKRLARAHADQRKYFPPITAATAIKQHLESQQKLRHEAVMGEGTYGMSQLDQSMQRSNKRGWNRPVRTAA